MFIRLSYIPIFQSYIFFDFDSYLIAIEHSLDDFYQLCFCLYFFYIYFALLQFIKFYIQYTWCMKEGQLLSRNLCLRLCPSIIFISNQLALLKTKAPAGQSDERCKFKAFQTVLCPEVSDGFVVGSEGTFDFMKANKLWASNQYRRNEFAMLEGTFVFVYVLNLNLFFSIYTWVACITTTTFYFLEMNQATSIVE